MKRPFGIGLPHIARTAVAKLKGTAEAISRASRSIPPKPMKPRPELRHTGSKIVQASVGDSFKHRPQHDRESVRMMDHLARGGGRKVHEEPHKRVMPMAGNRSVFKDILAPASARPSSARIEVHGKQPGERNFHKQIPESIDPNADYDVRLLHSVEWRQHQMMPHMGVRLKGFVLSEIMRGNPDAIAVARIVQS